MLIIENGSGVPGACSYASVDCYRDWLAKRGYDHPCNDTDAQAELVRAMDVLEVLCWQGHKTHQHQELSWPRSCVYERCGGCEPVPSRTIPKPLKTAQMMLAYQISQGVDFMAANDQRIIREKVDVLEVEYSDRADTRGSGLYRYPQIMALIRGYLQTGQGMIDRA